MFLMQCTEHLALRISFQVERHIYPLSVVSVSELYYNTSKRVGQVQSGHHSSHQNVTCSYHDIAE